VLVPVAHRSYANPNVEHVFVAFGVRF